MAKKRTKRKPPVIDPKTGQAFFDMNSIPVRIAGQNVMGVELYALLNMAIVGAMVSIHAIESHERQGLDYFTILFGPADNTCEHGKAVNAAMGWVMDDVAGRGLLRHQDGLKSYLTHLGNAAMDINHSMNTWLDRYQKAAEQA